MIYRYIGIWRCQVKNADIIVILIETESYYSSTLTKVYNSMGTYQKLTMEISSRLGFSHSINTGFDELQHSIGKTS